jgi:hypothetical protein
MSFLSPPRREKREFKYKPRFSNTSNHQKNGEDTFDTNEFAERLHRSWDRKRTNRTRNKFPLKTLIWLMFIVIILVYLFYKFLM